MSVLKTGIALAFIVFAAPVAATTLPQVFAGCTGRFSAELEHAWLMQDAEAEVLELRRARFEELLAAATPEGMRSTLLDQRIKAKAAHAHILRLAQFSHEPDTSRWARRRADVEIAYCEGLLLDG